MKNQRKVKKVIRTATKTNLAKPIPTGLQAFKAQNGWRNKIWYILGAFTPSRMKAYWFSRKGVMAILKMGAAVFLGLVLAFIYFAKDLPSPSKINARVSAQTTKIFARDELDSPGKGTLLYEVYGDQNRSVVEFGDISTYVKQATISIEDKNFYKHGAFSSIGILRAAFVNFVNRGKGIQQGGSTITQQYVKKALLTDNQTYSRKIKEIIMSIEIEQLYKKDDILKLYLNEIPYGGQAYGIEAACKTYFPYHGETNCAKNLTLEESAMLAAMVQQPSYYSPYGSHRTQLTTRQRLVLDLMVEQKYITKDQAETAKATDVFAKMPKTLNVSANKKYPHYVDYVLSLLREKYGDKVIDEGGYKIITTIDPSVQKKTEDAIAKNIANVRSLGGHNSAAVVSDPKTGQVLSMVGSYDYNDPDFGNVNVATSERQPGSSFKPFVYATAFGKNYGPGTTLYDVSTDFGGGYKPQNYSGTTYGVQSMRSALAGSLNIPAVKTLYLAGIQDSLNTAHAMGITTLNDTPDQYGLSLVLGSGEVRLVDMANAYGGFANGGTNVPQAYVLKMTDPKGSVVEQYKQPTPKRVLDPQVAYLISSVLSDSQARVFSFGNYSPLIIPGHNTAVKTGTTSDYKDAWTVGYTPSYVVGVWSGNNDNASMTKAASAISAPIWHDIMTAVLTDKPNEEFARPDGIKQVTLDADTGKLPTDATKHKRTDIFASWYKPVSATDAKTVKVDKVSGKLATDCTPTGAIESRTSSDIHAEIPASDLAFRRWDPPVVALGTTLGFAPGGNLPTDSDNVHSCADQKPTVNITQLNDDGNGHLTIQANYNAGTFGITKLEFFDNDQTISTQNNPAGTNYVLNYNPTTTGSHTFKVIVTDSGLYTAEDSQEQTVNQVAGASSIQLYTPAENGFVIKNIPYPFKWADVGDATYTVTVYKNANVVYQTPPSNTTQAAVTLTQSGDYTWRVVGDSGSQSVLGNFKIN